MAVVQRGSPLLAADGVAGDDFGKKTALSSNGLALAVSAWKRADGATSEAGAVYIYDWSGSAWVQRGSVLVAPTPVAGGHFGYDMALSADGLVLAVGEADNNHGAYYGYIHVYDWSGSAWVLRYSIDVSAANNQNFGAVVGLSGDGLVLAAGDYFNAGFLILDLTPSTWTQRGSLLTSPSFYNIGGDSVALSYDGAILAAGVIAYTNAGASNAGCVVLYDYAGGSWTERSAIVTPADFAAGDAFGSSVALSHDGAALYSGSSGWEGATGTDRGKMFGFTWSGTAWSETDGFEPTTPVDSNFFGTAAAVSDDALVLAIGATAWMSTSSGIRSVYVFDVTLDKLVAYTDLLVATAGQLVANTRLDVVAPSAIVANTDLTVSRLASSIVARASLDVTAAGTLVANTALALVDLSQHWPRWNVQVAINGTDISDLVKGIVEVDAEEGAARIARFSIMPASGTLAPLDYVGAQVAIDYLQTISGSVVARRLFTGRIDTPHYDPNTRILGFDCVDDLQNRVAALDRTTIDLLVGGKYSTAVQGDILDNWDYAQALLSTVPASLDAGAAGEIRVTDWSLAATWATFTDNDLKYDQTTLADPQRSRLVNKVEASFQYRYPRLRQRNTSTGWSGTQIDMAPNGWQYPKQQDLLSAAGGSGWTVTLGVFFPAPASIPHSSGGFIYPEAGSIDMAILHLAQRHSQTVTETFSLTVTAPESVTANGELAQSIRGALASNFDGNAWESALDVAPLMPDGGEMDYAPDAPRADADHAIETLLAQAQVKILGSHRSARVGDAVLLNPDLDLDKKVAIATTDITASGKVVRVRHVMDLEGKGGAVTEFEIACFGVGGAGIITPDTLAAPTPPAAAADAQDWGASVPVLQVNNYGVTPYSDALMGLLLNPPKEITVENIPGVGSKSFPNPYYAPGTYPVTGFRVQMPGVDDASRNPVDKAVASAYQIIIPSDTLTITVP